MERIYNLVFIIYHHFSFNSVVQPMHICSMSPSVCFTIHDYFLFYLSVFRIFSLYFQAGSLLSDLVVLVFYSLRTYTLNLFKVSTYSLNFHTPNKDDNIYISSFYKVRRKSKKMEGKSDGYNDFRVEFSVVKISAFCL